MISQNVSTYKNTKNHQEIEFSVDKAAMYRKIVER